MEMNEEERKIRQQLVLSRKKEKEALPLQPYYVGQMYYIGAEHENGGQHKYNEFMRLNPHLSFRNQPLPEVYGGLLVPVPGHRRERHCGQHFGGHLTGWTPVKTAAEALDHHAVLYDRMMKRRVAIGMPNCLGVSYKADEECCSCISTLISDCRKDSLKHADTKQGKADPEMLRVYVGDRGSSWRNNTGGILVIVASSKIPITIPHKLLVEVSCGDVNAQQQP